MDDFDNGDRTTDVTGPDHQTHGDSVHQGIKVVFPKPGEAITTFARGARPPETQASGLMKHGDLLVRFEKGTEELVAVCADFAVEAMVHNLSDGTMSRRFKFTRITDGAPQVLVVPEQVLHESPGQVISQMAAAGWFVQSADPESRRVLQKHMQALIPARLIYTTSKPGWWPVQGDPNYVTSAAVVGPDADYLRVTQAGNADFGVGGTTSEWRAEVASLAVGNSRCTFALSFAFSSILLHFSGLESGGVNFVGETSAGKSTLLRMASSVFGPRTYMKRLRATTNAMEKLAFDHHGSLLVVDELGQMAANEVGNLSYTLANGQGKFRATKFGHAAGPLTWHLQFMMSGELTVAEHMSEAGREVKGGQEVRLLDIPAVPEGGHGVFEDLHGFADGAALADEIGRRTDLFYGKPAASFALAVLSNPDFREELQGRIEEKTKDLVDAVGGQPTGLIHRAAKRFALAAVAGEFATESGITGWSSGEATAAAATCFSDWLDGRTHPEEAELDPVEAVRSFLLEHDARFISSGTADDNRPRNPAGWVVRVNAGTTTASEYRIIPSIFRREVLRGIPYQRAVRKLAQQGYLRTYQDGSSTRYKVKCTHDLSTKSRCSTPVYAISDAILADPKDQDSTKSGEVF